MIDTKDGLLSKAHKELYEVIKRLSKQELSKIPDSVIINIQKTMDKDYVWKYDDGKELDEQNLLVETKALIVEMYERYLCPEDKKEFWNKYDRICLNMIDEKKKEEYNPDNIFKTKRNTQTADVNINLPIQVKKDNIFKRIINKIKEIFIKKSY